MEDKKPTIGLENLAPEILLKVAIQLPDLASLDSALRASPMMFRVFDEYAVEIIEAVLSSGHTHGHIRVIIRVIALIRSSTLPIASLAEFKKRVTLEAMQHRIRKSEDGFAPEMLPKETKSSILRGILATARTITCITIDCLQYYLDNFEALRPSHMLDQGFFFNHAGSVKNGNDTPIPPGHFMPKGRFYDIKKTGPPSWVEEQRVIRACWRVQVFYDLKKAAAHSLLSWPAEDIAVLNSSEPVKLLYDDTIPLIPYDEFVNPHPEFQEINSVVEYTNSTISSASDQIWTAPTHREVSRNWPTPKPQWKDWKKLVFTSPGYQFYFEESVFFLTHSERWPGPYSSPLLCFTRFGIAFWAEERISAHGLLTFPNQKGWTKKDWPHFYCYAWQSILSKERLSHWKLVPIEDGCEIKPHPNYR
jgi:hypothetical protein